MDKKLDEEIQTIYNDSKKRYGVPKIQRTIESNGRKVSFKRVQRHMTTFGLRSIAIKKYRLFHLIKRALKKNILKRDFVATGINQKWGTDITYIYTLKDSWTYLASVIDFYSKKIIG